VASFFLPEFVVRGLQLIGLEFVKRFEDGTRVSDSSPTLVRVRLGLSVALSRIPQLKEKS
jgi:hypothetical protein